MNANPAKFESDHRRHHARYKRLVEAQRPKLTCQECHGGGEFYIDYFPELGGGPVGDCGFCEGTGLVTPHMRGLWLKWKREEKREFAHK